MPRRHLTFAVVALASLIVAACSSSPTAPQSQLKAPTPILADSVARSGWIGSGG